PVTLTSKPYCANRYMQHPSGILPAGTAESLTGISIADLDQFHRCFYSTYNSVYALVGVINRAGAERIAQLLLNALLQGTAPSSTPSPEPITSSHRNIEFNGEQTHVLVGQHGISRHDPDYVALYVGNQILGGSGFGSRLMEEIRET